MNTVIILAGGTGTRVGEKRPKQFIDVLGKPVLAYTCEIFQKNKNINAIEIVCHNDWINYCQSMVEKYALTKVLWIVPGGETFQDSVINGLRHLEGLLKTGEVKINDNVFIQYGAAPFTSQKIVNAVIEMTRERGSAVTATPCYQLLSQRRTDTTSTVWVDRDKYIQIACPYGFRFNYILDIYKRAVEQGLIDIIEPHTTSLMYALGETINYTYGDQTNIKITTAEDIKMFEGYVMTERMHTNTNTTGQVICCLADGFEECEALLVVDILRRAKIDVLMASTNGSRKVISSRKISVIADALIENVNFDSADMLFLPGGQIGTENLQACQIVRDKCIEFAKEKKIAAICAAPSILAYFGLLEGKKVAVHPDYVHKMNQAYVLDQSVVVDNNIVTGQGLGTTFMFAFEIVKILAKQYDVDQIKKEICFVN